MLGSIDQRSNAGRAVSGIERRGVHERPQGRERPLIVECQIHVELREPSGVEPLAVDEPQVGAVEQDRPCRVTPNRLGDREPPPWIEARAPCGDEEHDAAGSMVALRGA